LSIFFSHQLAALGWDSYFDEKFKQFASEGGVPARVIADYGTECLVHDGVDSSRATVGRHLRNDGATMPAVGDWVSLLKREPVGAILGVVERRTVFARKAPGTETREQVLAANVDVAFVVAAATDVNVRRIERYLTVAWQSGAVPVVLLTKADIAESLEELRSELEAVALGTPVIVTSAVTGDGIDEILRELQPARTGVLLGPSGAGKSTLINRIVGSELMRTRLIHRSGEGRHMTSHRQLVQLPQGGMIIDTPGLREAQLWEGEEALVHRLRACHRAGMRDQSGARGGNARRRTVQELPQASARAACGGGEDRRAHQAGGAQEVEADLGREQDPRQVLSMERAWLSRQALLRGGGVTWWRSRSPRPARRGGGRPKTGCSPWRSGRSPCRPAPG